MNAAQKWSGMCSRRERRRGRDGGKADERAKDGGRNRSEKRRKKSAGSRRDTRL